VRNCLRTCELNTVICVLAVAGMGAAVSCQVSSRSDQTSSVPYDPDYGPGFALATSSYNYPSLYASIHDVDFQNLPVSFGKDLSGKPFFYDIRHGKCRISFHSGGETSAELKGVHYLNSSQGGCEYALVLYEEDDAGGSSSQFGHGQIFALADQHLRVVQQLDWDLHYGGPYGEIDAFNEQTNTLSIRSAHHQPGDRRVASAVDIVIFRWDGQRVVQGPVRTELSDFGKMTKKTLGRF